MINNYPEALEHFYNVGFLNDKGLIAYIKLLKEENINLKLQREKNE